MRTGNYKLTNQAWQNRVSIQNQKITFFVKEKKNSRLPPWEVINLGEILEIN